MCIVADRGGGGSNTLRLMEDDPLLTSHSAFELLKAFISSLV